MQVIITEMNGFRISKSREEIIKVLQKKFEAENLMTIWQKDLNNDERMFKCDVKFSSIDPYNGTFSVAVDDINRKNFNSTLETYFLLKVQDFVFKTKVAMSQSSDKQIINFQIPHDVRLKELRMHPRVYINGEEKRFVSVTFENKDGEKKPVGVACPIFNISKSGICIIVSKETLSAIKLNESIDVEGLSFFDSLANKMKAVVRNARVYGKKGIISDEYYALGLEFQNT